MTFKQCLTNAIQRYVTVWAVRAIARKCHSSAKLINRSSIGDLRSQKLVDIRLGGDLKPRRQSGRAYLTQSSPRTQISASQRPRTADTDRDRSRVNHLLLEVAAASRTTGLTIPGWEFERSRVCCLRGMVFRVQMLGDIASVLHPKKGEAWEERE